MAIISSKEVPINVGEVQLHDLSGVAGLLQASELSRLAAAAESALLHGITDNLLVQFDQLQAAMDTVKMSTQQFFGEAIV